MALDIEKNTIHTGNCTDIMAAWPAGCIDLTVTSPPYDDLRDYKGYTFNAEAILSELLRVTRQGGICVWVVNDRTINGNQSLSSFKQAMAAQNIGWLVHDIMIYEKNSISYTHADRYMQTIEFMLIFRKPGGSVTFNPIMQQTKYQGKTKQHRTRHKSGEMLTPEKYYTVKAEKRRSVVWRYAVGYLCNTRDIRAHQHPAIFPDKLARDHIHTWSNPGDTVLDPMCGSGTTCQAAALQNRNYIGIDIAPEYTELAEKRVADLPTPLAI